MNKHQIENINILAEKKLKELEESDLTKEEILGIEDDNGIPLKVDPFFQMIKDNRLTRQSYFDQDDVYTVDSIIDLALR